MRKWNVLLVLALVLSLLVPVGARGAESLSTAPAYLVLDDDTNVSWSLEQDLYIDLNGNYLTGIIETNGYKVYGMDTFTDSYDAGDAGRFRCKDADGQTIVPESYAKTDLSGQTKWYMTVAESDGYSFRRIYLGITHATLAPAVDGVGFKAQFRCDEEVRSRVASLNYLLWMENGQPVERSVSDFRESLSLRLKNIPPETYGEVNVYAKVQMTMTDGTVLESSTSTLTLRSVVEQINNAHRGFDTQQLEAVWDMIQRNPVMGSWEVSNLHPDNWDNACLAHADSDDNGLCDLCDTDVRVIIDLYAVNDLHGKLADGDSHPGVDELSTYFDNAKASRDNVILLSSGDMWQGAAESNLTRGLILTDWMNQMGFVSMTIGNHEFDWGQDAIRTNAEYAQFPFLAINIYDKATNSRVDYAQSSVVVEADGLQIGIIGAVGDCYSSISAEFSEGVTFKTGSALTKLIKDEATRLRNGGVDFIVLSVHDGFNEGYYDTSLSDGYVDLVFEAHTHQSYVQQDTYGVYHLQGGGDNTGISYACVAYNTVNETYKVAPAQNLKSSTYSSLPDHPVVQQLLDKYADQINMADRVLGYNRAYRDDSVVEQKVADLYIEAAVEEWGSTYNIVLGGGFLRTRSPYNLYAGQVTYGDLMSLLPFDNRLVLCKIKGTYLKSRFINNTSSDYYIAYSEYGNRVKNSIQNNTYYYVVVDTYTAYYSYNNLTIVDYYEDNIYARDLLAEYIQEGNWS